MSIIAVAVKHMLDAGMPADAIVAAVAAMEDQVQTKKSAGAQRQQRYRERNKASQTVTRDDSDVCDESDAGVTLLPLEGSSPTPPSPKTPSSLPPSPPKGGSSPAEFEKFWEAYPQQIDQPSARRAFAAARKRVDFDTLMDGLARYVAKTDDRPWCNPANWLKGDRWNDPAPAANGAVVAEKPEVDWLDRVQRWRRGEFNWPPAWGPKPGEPGCRAQIPADRDDPIVEFARKAGHKFVISEKTGRAFMPVETVEQFRASASGGAE